MAVAFKEWAVIIDALGQGRQIVILRKGGIHEGRGGFRAEQQEFLLFPTLFHQQREAVIPPAQARYDQIAPAFRPDRVRMEYFCQVAESRFVSSWEQAAALAGQHIWREDLLRDRFAWGRDQGIFALAVRVYELRQPIELGQRPEFGGCKSWVELPDDLPIDLGQPVLAAALFEEKLNAFRGALEVPGELPIS